MSYIDNSQTVRAHNIFVYRVAEPENRNNISIDVYTKDIFHDKFYPNYYKNENKYPNIFVCFILTYVIFVQVKNEQYSFFTICYAMYNF